MSAPSETQRVDVVNVDVLWSAQPRWYRLGDLSLGDRGVPQIVVFYAIAGVLSAWLLAAVPVVGLPWWPFGVVVICGFGGAGFLRPNGLPVHTFLPTALAYLVASKHLHGWRATTDPTSPWSPGELGLETDGSRGRFEALVFEGPGRAVRHRPAQRLQGRRTVADRVRRRPAVQVLRQRPGRLAGPQVLEVGEGERLVIEGSEG